MIERSIDRSIDHSPALPVATDTSRRTVIFLFAALIRFLSLCCQNDKINGLTIHYSFNRDERWTTALKYMLTKLKVLLSWVTEMSDNHDVISK